MAAAALLLSCGHVASAIKILASCSTAVNYTAGSTFQANLAELLPAVTSSTTAHSGFANHTVGHGSSTVYGLAMCYAEALVGDCQSCLAVAPADIVAACPFSMEAALWSESCFLRYSNENYFGHLHDGVQVYAANTKNVSDQAQFIKTLGALMSQLGESIGGNPKLVAYGNASVGVDGSTTIRGLLQCTQDLAGDKCTACAISLIRELQNCCSWVQGTRIYGYSCYLRFETLISFYLSSNYLPSPSSPAAAISPLSQEESRKSQRAIQIALAAVGAGFLLFILIAFGLTCRPSTSCLADQTWNCPLQ